VRRVGVGGEVGDAAPEVGVEVEEGEELESHEAEDPEGREPGTPVGGHGGPSGGGAQGEHHLVDGKERET